MTSRSGRTTLLVIMICIALPAWGQQNLLYVPQPAPADQKEPSQDGILVREIEIQKGDSLYKLSRRFSGHGMYFPQILLFNNIKNPDLIYTGNMLKVPVTRTERGDSAGAGSRPPVSAAKPKAHGGKNATHKNSDILPTDKVNTSTPASATSTELSLSDLNKGETKKGKPARENRKSVSHVKKAPTQEPKPPTPSQTRSTTAKDATGQKLYESAVKAFHQNDCRTALELFDRYLADNSASLLAADANLYKAECYLKLSAQ